MKMMAAYSAAMAAYSAVVPAKAGTHNPRALDGLVVMGPGSHSLHSLGRDGM
jgi:hypothetical protein